MESAYHKHIKTIKAFSCIVRSDSLITFIIKQVKCFIYMRIAEYRKGIDAVIHNYGQSQRLVIRPVIDITYKVLSFFNKNEVIKCRGKMLLLLLLLLLEFVFYCIVM